MTFTYAPSAAPDNVTQIRYHLSDTDKDTAIYTDEEINMVVAMEGTVGAAVISLIKGIMSKLAMEPDMSADWLKIDWRRSSDAWGQMLTEKRREFGLGASISSGGRHAYRPDTLEKTPPDYGEE